MQVVWGKTLQEKAVDQWTREIPVKARRGEILAAGNELLVGNAISYSVFIRPRSVTNKERVVSTLAALFSIDDDKLIEKITNQSASEITVIGQITKEQALELEKFDLDGVYYSIDNTRIYPLGDALSSVLGYTSTDGVGICGLESYYNKYLAGEKGEIVYEADLVGRDLAAETPTYIPATDGLDIKLTIDLEIQLIAEAVIAKAFKEYTPKSASAIVLDVTNGNILALSQNPSINLNNLPRNDIETLNKMSRNTLIVDSYEPGSTFKIFTSAANVQEHLYGNTKALSLDYVFNSARTRSIGGRQIKCWSTHANGKHSNQTLQEALNNSCNPCFVDIAASLGKETLYKYLQAFRFGKVTGVDFQGEAMGMMLPLTAVTEGDIARISFGQTIAVTPLQLAAGVSAVINGGYYYSPHFLEEIYDKNTGISQKYKASPKEKVLSTEASTIIASYLEGVVANGSGKNAYIEGYRVGGKTGTAQKYENGIIAQGKYIMSFIGFFPADKPKYLALAIVDEPVGGTYGSTVAAPIVKEIFEGIIKTKNIKSGV